MKTKRERTVKLVINATKIIPLSECMRKLTDYKSVRNMQFRVPNAYISGSNVHVLKNIKKIYQIRSIPVCNLQWLGSIELIRTEY